MEGRGPLVTVRTTRSTSWMLMEANRPQVTVNRRLPSSFQDTVPSHDRILWTVMNYSFSFRLMLT